MTRLDFLPAKYVDQGLRKLQDATLEKPRKYRNEPTWYNGIRYDSKREAEFAKNLDLSKHAQGSDRVESWDRQIRFPLVVNNVTVGHMVVDFLVYYTDRRKELVEIKSTATQTPLFKFKLKVFQATVLQDHPEINYSIVT
jgi:hypothetical protein